MNLNQCEMAVTYFKDWGNQAKSVIEALINS